MSKIFSAGLKAKDKAKAWTFKAMATGAETKAKAIKIWPRGISGPGPGLEDYNTDSRIIGS